ncbi:LacI family transcriptional regulator [Paenibacillus nanensis]|uniref:LacI family transcriptional regulator n=1 Tax=Paenibacillus nanensis TaxID=393251 RepID=A0A3A1UN94_9BACL|nr:LacI family DNA-binding transcriptional regulator [Paenibacillus nanensis]RIX50018.1 LacI family transcriptional regulator [Paenibacillus nanensis]
MVTIYDIANKANVSAMTVSRVINNTGRVSDKTRAKVKKVMQELNYVPNQMARSLVLQQSKTLFLLITDITNPFYTTLSRGAEDAARKHGYNLLFGNSDENLSKESEYINTILSTRVDGVLLAPAGDPSAAHLERLLERNVPFVLIDREVPGIQSDIVQGDSKEASKKLMEHLLSYGHRNIALVNGSSSISSARDRLQGYNEMLKLHDLSANERYIFETSFGPFKDQSGLMAWLDQLHPFPTAFLAGNNVLAMELLHALRSRGLQVPEDVSVVCFDDFGMYSDLDPFITVAAQQAYQFGYLGMQLLIERITDREEAGPQKKIILPAEIIVRRSVKKLA